MLDEGYVKAIEDWLKWYNEHAHKKSDAGENTRGVDQRLEFLEKALRGCFIIMSGLTTEVERIDVGREAAERRRALQPLILPLGRFS